MSSPHVGDDFNIIIAVMQNGAPKDISAATERKIFIERQMDSKIMIKDAEFVTDGRDGRMMYRVSRSENTMCGVWRVSGRIRWADGTTRSTRSGWFKIISAIWECCTLEAEPFEIELSLNEPTIT